jgi:hypothetical protein
MSDSYPPPYWTRWLAEALEARPELSSCAVTIEAMELDEQTKRAFPHLTYDPARVFIRFEDRAMNVHCSTQQGKFFYRAVGYLDAGPPFGSMLDVAYDGLPTIIEHVIAQLDPFIAAAAKR